MPNKLVDVYYYFKHNNYPRITNEELDSIVSDALKNTTPLMAGRLGATESAVLRMCEFNYIRKKEKCFNQLCMWSGFFPKQITLLDRFHDIYTRAISNADVVYPMLYKGENYLLEKYTSPGVKYTKGNLFNTAGQCLWTRHLKGKKVLIIHPFEQTIKKQYAEKREKLHKNKDVLPEFELKTIKAVQTIAYEKDDRFNDWFEALDWMHDESLKVDYDIALIGCGAYGFPLASMIKNDGKIAIHIGGSLQLMFGIKGMRWEMNPETVKQLYNDNWVYASDEERPERFDLIEGSSYWQKPDKV